MGGAPATLVQLALIVLFIAPGVTYQLLRERRRGSKPGEQDIAQRVLRALIASVVLDAIYVLLIGPELINLFEAGRGWDGLHQHSRSAAALILGLVFAVPTGAAWGVSELERRRLRSSYRSTPTAWDHAFRDCPPSFVRIRLKDGSWVGGWYGSKSYATSFPHPPELFLERSYRMKSDGSFSAEVTRSMGMYVKCTEIDFFEILANSESGGV
ncbi:DUF6338 family protein [Streptomyces sp. XY332]|uniref:DUF6338 family protein n=1 Tax=Streptomyces sp. XY332 TaxID=1415561 RepID=UPI00099BFE4C|nr:DUF6338 family protein [Streptomyces sp. XY332]